MSFTVRDYEILSSYQDLGESPIYKTAEATSFKSHTVRRTVAKALRAGLLFRKAHLQMYELGYRQYATLISFDTKSEEQEQRVRETLSRAPHLELVLALAPGGQFQYYVLITAEGASALEGVFSSLSKMSETPITRTRIQVREGYYYYGVKYLGSLRCPTPLHIRPSERRVNLPPEDLEVLEVFSASPNGVRTQMARTLAMPLMTLQYRIERLEKFGLIQGVRYHIDSNAVGHIQFRCLITSTMPLESHRDQLSAWAQTEPYVVALTYGVGGWDYELRIEAPSHQSAQDLVARLVKKFSHTIRNAELLPATSVIRLASYSPRSNGSVNLLSPKRAVAAM
jgi:DNA-binding Lrp family transcriptional regulator